MNIEELNEYLKNELDNPADTYSAHVEQMADIMHTVFNFIADELGASGYSASLAELQFLSKSRRIEGPFAIMCARDMLYPQYNLADQALRYERSWMAWASQAAKEKLEKDKDIAVPKVIEHWERLAQLNEPVVD